MVLFTFTQSCENIILCNFIPFALSVKGSLHPLTMTVFQHHLKALISYEFPPFLKFHINKIINTYSLSIYFIWYNIYLVACFTSSFLPWLNTIPLGRYFNSFIGRISFLSTIVLMLWVVCKSFCASTCFIFLGLYPGVELWLLSWHVCLVFTASLGDARLSFCCLLMLWMRI